MEMVQKFRSLDPTFRLVLILGLFVGLLFLPRLLQDVIHLPNWWTYLAFVVFWVTMRMNRSAHREHRTDHSDELRQYANELGLSYTPRTRKSMRMMTGQIDGRNIWITFSKDVLVRVNVDYGFSDSIWSRSVKRYGGDQLLTEDPEFDERFRIAAGKDEWDAAHAKFKAKYLSDSPHSPIQDGTILDWLSPSRRSALTALDEVAEIERLQWNTIELRLREEPQTFDELRDSIEFVMRATETFQPFDQPFVDI